MSTLTVNTPERPFPPPRADQVFGFARTQIHHAAAHLWPHSRIDLGAHVASITGYVTHLTVDDQPLYAKYDFLGMSLVSLLRGVGGTWPEVRSKQAAYIQRPDALMAREHAQLQLLDELDGPRVSTPAGLAHGVLFTNPVPGDTLGDLLLRAPQTTVSLLERTLAELRPLYRARTAPWLGPAGAIGERSIAATFARKFNGISGQTYLDSMGADRCPPEAGAEAVAHLRAGVARLRHARLRALQPTHQVLLYGDLKPEHVIFPHGAAAERPHFIDPGLSRGRATGDIAKLISRIVMRLLIAHPAPSAAERLLDSLDDFARRRITAMPGKAARTWQREVLTFWLMDTANLLSTILAAPPDLPLNERTGALAAQPLAVCRLLDRLTTVVIHQHDAATAWDTALSTVRGATA
ncbi:phosphotransferase (plasmid) [Streptomyces sp. SDT5-1]|uniref:phosphotransferase n=1 Tax=Streptomyces sp. SDT5-1 TaxID=3406418 RepID=UPI003FD0DA96